LRSTNQINKSKELVGSGGVIGFIDMLLLQKEVFETNAKKGIISKSYGSYTATLISCANKM
jgi:hypothetical protein